MYHNLIKGGNSVSFKKYLTEIKSVRDYEQSSIGSNLIGEVKEYINEINNAQGKESGFSLTLFENGARIFEKFEGVGGYSGIMIKSPHYIGLFLEDEKIKSEFFGAYYMQSVVKKLYELGLGSCWINIRSVSPDIKNDLVNKKGKLVNYLLSFGKPDDKLIKQKSSSIHVQSGKSYKTNPYGTDVVESTDTETCRLALNEIVYLYEWGQEASYEELENRGLADLFLYVRNAPSYKNKQPTRFILKDGEAFLAILNPNNKENITDGGIMLYTIEGMAKDLGIPANWSYLGMVDESFKNQNYKIFAKIDL